MIFIVAFNNFTLLITITTLAAHAVIWEGLINMFWFRELLTNNCIQPRVAIEIEGRTKTFQPMGPLNVSFVKSAGLLRRINGVTTINYRIIEIIDGNKSVISMDWMIFLRSHYLPVKYLLLLSGQNNNGNMCPYNLSVVLHNCRRNFTIFIIKFSGAWLSSLKWI